MQQLQVFLILTKSEPHISCFFSLDCGQAFERLKMDCKDLRSCRGYSAVAKRSEGDDGRLTVTVLVEMDQLHLSREQVRQEVLKIRW